MIRRYFRFLARRAPALVALLTLFSFLSISIVPAWAMNSVRGDSLPQPLPPFPQPRCRIAAERLEISGQCIEPYVSE